MTSTCGKVYTFRNKGVGENILGKRDSLHFNTVVAEEASR